MEEHRTLNIERSTLNVEGKREEGSAGGGLDKKLSGVACVQTLSRLNRTKEEKDEVGQLARRFFILHPSSLRPGVVNPVAKKWQCGADIPVCFFLVKQEGRV